MTDGNDDEDGVSRRWLIRLLVGLGIGVPVAVEAATFLGLVNSRLFGGGGDGEQTNSTTRRPVTHVGDELLPATAPADTLTDAVVRVGEDAWTFEASVRVENTGDAPYRFSLGAVTTEGGRRVGGGAETDWIPPGETRTASATWTLPSGATPATMAVAGVTRTDGGERRTEAVVRLGSVPVQG
ncbi:MAG: hypothetical protein ABEJ88_04050 [Halobacterium sp.]